MNEEKLYIQQQERIEALELKNAELEQLVLQQSDDFERITGQLEEQVVTRVRHLREQKEKLQAMTENIPGVVYQFYASNTGEIGVHYTSPKLYEIFGLEFIDDGPLFMQKFSENIYAEDQQSWVESITNVIEKQIPWYWEGRYVKPSGEIIWFEGRSVPTVRENEIIFDGLFLETTEKKQIELQLLEAKQKAEQLNRVKSEFLANMSHEMRTPMHGILSFAHLGNSRINKVSKEKLRHYFQHIQSSGSRLMGLLDDLLDLAKFEASKMTYAMVEHDICHVMTRIVEEFHSVIEEKKFSLTVQVSDKPLLTVFDSERIGQVLRNLLANSIQFSAAGDTIHLEVKDVDISATEGQCSEILVAVIDQGVGIPEAELETIFDKFIQSSKTKTGAGGTGLGLAICKQIVDDHGGRIWAENNRDGGAVFRFTLPGQSDLKLAKD